MMQFTIALLALLTPASASFLSSPQHVFSNPNPIDDKDFPHHRIPTVHESAVQARRILHLTNLATLSTIFPTDNTPSPHERRPSTVGGSPIGLMDYYADCEPATGNPTLLAISIATSFKNAAAGSNITLSARWHPPDAHKRFYSTAALPRFSLIGHIEKISSSDADQLGLAVCFVRSHPDAAAWLPGNPIHRSEWARLVVDEIYWVGGFGDRAYIGWIPVEEWRSVTQDEIDQIRLPGEQDQKSGWQGWKEFFGLSSDSGCTRKKGNSAHVEGQGHGHGHKFEDM